MSGHVFVTGASGRVAAALIPALIARGQRVVGLARSQAKVDAVIALGADCLLGDLSRPDIIDQGLDGAHTIYHLAGGMRGPGKETPDRINRQGTLALLDRIPVDHAIESFVFTSSCAVHGDRSGLWVDEDMPAHPHTRYGRSKLSAEQALMDATETKQLPLRIVRLAAVYGPGFPFLLEDAIRKGRAWLPGEGRNIVPTIHIEDAVSGLLRIGSSEASHTLYNLADQQPVSLRELYSTVAKATQGKPPTFWSTWVPSYIQFSAARFVERVQSQTPMIPKFTPDAIRLFTASVRLNVDRISSDLGMEWRHPRAIEGVTHTLSPD